MDYQRMSYLQIQQRLFGVKFQQNPSIIYAFNEDDNSRLIQDVGLDGLTDTEERE